MKVVLCSVRPEDVDFFKSELSEFQAQVYTQRLEEIDIDKISDADILSVFVFDKLNAETLKHFKNLKLIVTRSAGFDHIDLEYCKEHNIKVAHLPAYSPSAIAQHAFAMILNLVRKLKRIDRKIQKLDFAQSSDIVGENLEDLTLGVVGTGRIGFYTAKYGIAFGMRVLAFDVRENEELKQLGVEYVDYETLLKNSDIVSFHVPLTPKTKHMLNSENIKLLKDGAIVINTSRGGVIDTDALYEAYKSGKISALGLDVFEDERILILNEYEKGKSSDKVLKILKLATKDNVVIAPHIAYMTKRALENMRKYTVEVIKKFAKGEDISKYLVKI